AIEGNYAARFGDADLLAAPVDVANRGSRPAGVRASISGVPAAPEPAGGNGYTIERAYYDLDGNEVSLQDIALGTRLFAVLTVTTTQERAARLIVHDPLPAGFEIDNPNLVASADVPDIEAIDSLDATAHTEFRGDRFVAAVDRAASDP